MSFISAQNLCLQYHIYGADMRSLKRALVNVATGGCLNGTKNKVVVNALDNVTFHLSKGDRLGIIGHNGAGKSTLLKVLAGIYQPQQGTLNISGQISPLLDIHVGMQYEATGYENIKIRNLMMGHPSHELQKTVAHVEEFADLGRYMSVPVKTYSSGMMMRLAFGMSTANTPDILLIDEMISVGDASFMKKAEATITNLMDTSNIVVLSSHSDQVIKQFCNKILWLERGCVKAFGDLQLLDAYNNLHNPKTEPVQC